MHVSLGFSVGDAVRAVARVSVLEG
jgi:hypothetical protein